MDAVLEALADPKRRAIYRQIEQDPGIVCSLLDPSSPRSTVSVQLRRLREAGLIEQKKSGQLVSNRVREDGAWARFGPIIETILASGGS